MLKRRLTAETFEAILRNEIMPQEKQKKRTILTWLNERRLERQHEKNGNN